MSNTIERTINSVTERLDDLESALPTIPSKALAATRASARRLNEVAESAVCSARSRADRVRNDVDTAASTSVGQARSAIDRTASSARRGVAETKGQVVAQSRRVASTATDNVEGALDDAKLAADPDHLSTWTKAELYERAQELDIEGRSAMTKAELVRAIQRS